jgi:hypothetical protein
MSAHWTQVKEVFSAALEIEPRERDSFLNEVCATDDHLRAEVSALLSAPEASGDFIRQPALVDVGLLANDQVDDSAAVIGQQIGSYKIIRDRRGGMGAVYLAVRADEASTKLWH